MSRRRAAGDHVGIRVLSRMNPLQRRLGRLCHLPNAWIRLFFYRVGRARRLLLRNLGLPPEPSSSWELPDSEAACVDDALDWRKARRAPHEVLVLVRDQPITRKTMSRMRAGEWLNDELINGYLGLLGQCCATPDMKRAGVHVMSTYFYAKLAGASGYNYEGVRRWTKNVELRKCLLVLIPVNVGNEHWILVVIDVRRRRFDVWDSFRTRHAACVRIIRRYVADEWLHKYGEKLDIDAWPCEYRKDAPLQHNGSDCGVFVCAVARCLAFAVAIDVSQNVMMDIRRRMVCELMKCTIILRRPERTP